MLLENIGQMYRIVASNGEEAFLWRQAGLLRLYDTKWSCLNAQLNHAQHIYKSYVRNCAGQRAAGVQIDRLVQLLAEEEKAELRN